MGAWVCVSAPMRIHSGNKFRQEAAVASKHTPCDRSMHACGSHYRYHVCSRLTTACLAGVIPLSYPPPHTSRLHEPWAGHGCSKFAHHCCERATAGGQGYARAAPAELMRYRYTPKPWDVLRRAN